MKKKMNWAGGTIMMIALLGYGCGSGSTGTSGQGAQSFNDDTFSVTPHTPSGNPQNLPVIADPVSTNNQLVIKCEPGSTTSVGDYIDSVCKLSTPPATIRFTCLNGKVQGYQPSVNCERLTLDCNQSGFSQNKCEETIKD